MLGTRRRAALAALLAAGCRGAADEACIVPPCLAPTAATVHVTAAGGAAVAGAFTRVSGTVTSSGPCDAFDGTCRVMGAAGTYEIDVGAPGYATVHRSITVTGTTPRCGCPTVDTQHLDVVLARQG